MNTTDKIKHPKINLTLTIGEWEMMGFRFYANGEWKTDNAYPYELRDQVDKCLLIAASSDSPAATFCALMLDEMQLRNARSAMVYLADAIKSHGSAIARSSTADAVETIMSRLSDRTKWAVRSQLKGTGILS